MRTPARIITAAVVLVVALVSLAGCSAAPVSVPSASSSVTTGSPANRMLLSVRHGDPTPTGIEIQASCQNLTATTMTVPARGLPCVIYAVSARSSEGTTEELLLLNRPLYSGPSYGGLASGGTTSDQAGRLPPGEGLQGSVQMALSPGQYLVRARLASATPIVAVPIKVNVTK